MAHISVLQKEVLEFLSPKSGENFIDCTVDGGGHALAVLGKIGSAGKLLGIDADETMIEKLKERIKNESLKNFFAVEGNFKNLKKIAEENNFKNIAGILFDLGWSSLQFEESGRGFSFLKNEPLDMRYSRKGSLTAADIVNDFSTEEIADILRKYGEERFARNIAKIIVEERKRKKILTTFDLVAAVKKAVPKRFHFGRVHPATKTFQALRIAVNGELENLEAALPQALDILGSGGRLAVISFHSLEDRIVKNFFREAKKEGKVEILTKKPVAPSGEEIKENPRSRSAKLRAVIKL